MISVTVWNEHIQEREEPVLSVYPDGMNAAIQSALEEEEGFSVRCVTMDQPHQGLPDELLNATDVLIWWGHVGHDQVEDQLIERIACRVKEGMGLIVLHSAHYSKLFRRLMGTECRSKWWEAGDHERIFTVLPGHPIAQGLPEYFELPQEETYCEHFNVPTPDELVFISWFSGGAALRSGLCYHYGTGKIFYFQPGHETYPIYYDQNIRRVLRNAARWAAPTGVMPAYGKHTPLEETYNNRK